MSEAHSYLEADVNHLVRVLAKPRGVLTRDQLADEAGADHWADGRFDAALREGTERGRIRDMGEGFYELSEQERSQLP